MMDLQKLFEIQAGLDKHINKEKGLEGQDLLPKKILALQVELGELAQNWRGFKFWSNDQEPRNSVEHKCKHCNGQGTGGIHHNELTESCRKCAGEGEFYSNPLLEEYVDCLHFILSIGLELGKENTDRWFVESNVWVFQYQNVTEQFIYINQNTSELYQGDYDYEELMYEVLGLGQMLGFTWEQIEQAYLDKNKINHQRQQNGY